MGYLSFDASTKIHQSGKHTSTKTSKTGNGGINGYIRHIDRGTDKRNGCEVQHSNENIDSDYTLENESYYKNEYGNWEKTTISKDMVKAVNRRIRYAREHGARIYDGGKNDTTIVRPLLVQLDGETIESHPDTWMGDTVEILEDTFGADNIVGVCVHRDETSVHLHVVFTPVYTAKDKQGNVKCAVSQTKFFKSPKSLAGMHKHIRKALQDKGYDIELENKPIEEQLAGYYDKQGEWHQQGLTPDQLKSLSDRLIKLKVKEIDMKLKKEELDRMESVLREMQDNAKMKRDKLDREKEEYEQYKESQKAIIQSQRKELEEDLEALKRELEALNAEKLEVEQMKAEATDMLDEVYRLSDSLATLVSDSNMNEKFLEYCDRLSKKTQRPFRYMVDNLYAGFKKEQESKLSTWQKEMLAERQRRKSYPTVDDTQIYVPSMIDNSPSVDSDYSMA